MLRQIGTAWLILLGVEMQKRTGVKARLILAALAAGFWGQAATADDFGTIVPMVDKGASTYYIPAEIDGLGKIELMVDTGSGYLTINEQALKTLEPTGQVRYLRKLRGVLANGSEIIVPVYSLNGINLGGGCRLQNVEAAVFPGNTRFILGLSVLTKASPFIFSVAPPQLTLSNCVGPVEKTADNSDT